ncbi:DUF885 family protein [bacterium]|nr:DUF885 family protein [bacterium]
MKSRSAVFLLTFAGFLSGMPQAIGQETEARKLTDWFKAYIEKVMSDEPMTATRLGDHRYDDRLEELSPDARKARLDRDKSALADLKKSIDPKKLELADRVDFEILARHLESRIWLTENFRTYEEDPRVWGDYLTESVYLLLVQSTLPKEKNFENALKRMKAIPAVVETARNTIGNPPKVKTETAILQTRGAIDFYTREIYLITGRKTDDVELKAATEPVVAALKKHLAFLTEQVLPRSGENWRVGRELFAKKLDYDLDSGLTAAEVLAEAEKEAEQVEREMFVIARQMWSQAYPGVVIPPDDPKGRRETIAKALAATAKVHGSPETLVTDAKATVADITKFIRARDILRLPEPDRCAIIEMPEFMRGNSVAYLNPAPPLDILARSEYAISPPPADWTAQRVESFLGEYNAAMLKVLTIHEAYPGHYVQLEYANRVPSLIRRVLGSGTYSEGWAVYTERMMLDQGFGEGDLALRLNQLKFYLRAVCNAILDHKMHCSGMTDEEARALLMDRAFQTEGEAVGKIIRSKQSSAQLSTYFVGRTAFHRLRQAVQREQGEKFDIGRFHEAVLEQGSVSVKYLPELVRDRLQRPRAVSVN